MWGKTCYVKYIFIPVLLINDQWDSFEVVEPDDLHSVKGVDFDLMAIVADRDIFDAGEKSKTRRVCFVF